MSLSRCSARRVAVWSAAAVLGGLALASTAWAAPTTPTNVTSSPSGPTNAGAITVNWNDALADEGVDPHRLPGRDRRPGRPRPDRCHHPGPGAGGPGPDGTYTFKVRAVQDLIDAGSYASIPIVIDRTAPNVAGATGTPGSAGVGGWFRAPLSFTFGTCTDANLGPSACTVPWTGEQGFFPAGARSLSVTDLAGNSGSGTLPAFGFDTAAPPRADLTGPGNLVPAEPTFKWFPRSTTATPDLSGVDEYRVQYRISDSEDPGFTTFAVVQDQNDGLREYTATRGQGLDPGDTPPPFPENTEISWRVRVFDKAGNFTSGLTRQFTIDPTVPPAPDITGGPVGPTQNTTPTFSWSGNGDTFRWDVLPAGSQTAIRSGNVQTKEVTVPALPDGAFTFRLTQFTAAGRESAEATRSFVVDTTPPAAPLILTRPTFPSVTDAVFTWATEPCLLKKLPR